MTYKEIRYFINKNYDNYFKNPLKIKKKTMKLNKKVTILDEKLNNEHQ